MPRSRSTRVSIGCGSTNSAESEERHGQICHPESGRSASCRAGSEASAAAARQKPPRKAPKRPSDGTRGRRSSPPASFGLVRARRRNRHTRSAEGGAARCCRGGSRRGAQRHCWPNRRPMPRTKRSGAGAPGGRCAGRARSAPRGAPGRAQSIEAAQQVDAAPAEADHLAAGKSRYIYPEEIGSRQS